MKHFMIAVLLVVFALGLTGCYPFNKQEFEASVVKAEETVVNNGESVTNLKLVKLSNEEWYKVEDEFLLGHFRSRDLWGSLNEGDTYEFKTYGWRIGFFSSYPNLVEAKEVQ